MAEKCRSSLRRPLERTESAAAGGPAPSCGDELFLQLILSKLQKLCPKNSKTKVAIVTDASKGIGAAITKALANEGAAVVVNYSSSTEAAEKIVAEVIAAGGRAVAVQADVSKEAEIERPFAVWNQAFGRLYIPVNNAGTYAGAPIGSITEESFHKHFDLNVLTLILASQKALPK